MSIRRAFRSERTIFQRLVAWTAIITLIGHVVTGMPAMLQMAAASAAQAAVSDSGQVARQDGGDCHHRHQDGTPLCDHDHCLLCQGGVGLFVVTAIVWLPPLLENARFGVTLDHSSGTTPRTAAYTSRAPPSFI